MIERKCDTLEPTVTENCVLVPKKQYDKLIRSAIYCRNFAEIAAEDWVKETERGYGGTSDAMKTTLRLYDRELFVRANNRVCDIEDKKKGTSPDLGRLLGVNPDDFPYFHLVSPGAPRREIKIGDDPGNEPTITCEGGGA